MAQERVDDNTGADAGLSVSRVARYVSAGHRVERACLGGRAWGK
ncbi:MAG: hypothetical protein P8Y27_19855 [Chromatiaceae bacterium]